MTRPTRGEGDGEGQGVQLLICTRCRQQGIPPDDAERPGAALLRRLAETGVEGVELVGVECLSNCERGCSVALRGPGRWTYVYGALSPSEHLETLREGAAKYAAAPDGLIPWRQRPEHFKRNCIARIPPLELSPSPREET